MTHGRFYPVFITQIVADSLRLRGRFDNHEFHCGNTILLLRPPITDQNWGRPLGLTI